MTIKNKEFRVNEINQAGLIKCKAIAQLYDDLLNELLLCGIFTDKRLEAIVRTKLEEACFFTKKACATNLTHQSNAKRISDQLTEEVKKDLLKDLKSLVD